MEIAANYQAKNLTEANQIISLLEEKNSSLTAVILQYKKELRESREKIAAIESQYENLQQQLKKFLHDKFGKKSEKYQDGRQLSLFGNEPMEGEEETNQSDYDATETISYTRKKPRNGHRNIPANLPRVRIPYELEDLTCPCGCGNKLYKIGEVVSEQLESVPAKIYVKQHVRFKYAGCKHQDKVITAPMPDQPIDKSLAGPGLLADVLVNKYDDHLPLYRQSERLARCGIEISRNTLGDWVMQCAYLLEPIVKAMRPNLFAQPKIHTDDTPVPVLEKGKDQTKEGRLWCYASCGPPLVIYEYTPNHQHKWPQEFLKKYRGYLQADCYPGYKKLYCEQKIIQVACMAHARRKFFDIVKTQTKPGNADKALKYIRELYRIETKAEAVALQIRERKAEPKQPKKYKQKQIIKRKQAEYLLAKKAYRKRYAKPILKAYKNGLLKLSIRVIPKGPLGKAIAYTLNNWIGLTRYLANGILDIDNNQAERLLRPVAVGRKNWIFAGNDRGGHAAATIYSLIETCKLNNINPYDYLRDVLARLPNTLNREIKSLFPYNWQPLTCEHIPPSSLNLK